MWNNIKTWSAMFTTPLAEALKEAFRVTLFSIPGELIIAIDRRDVLTETIIVNLLLIFLRALDRYLHEKSKLGIRDSELVKSGGLSPI